MASLFAEDSTCEPVREFSDSERASFISLIHSPVGGTGAAAIHVVCSMWVVEELKTDFHTALESRNLFIPSVVLVCEHKNTLRGGFVALSVYTEVLVPATEEVVSVDAAAILVWPALINSVLRASHVTDGL